MLTIEWLTKAVALLAAFGTASGGFAWAFRAIEKRKQVRAADVAERESAVTAREKYVADQLQKSNAELLGQLNEVRKELASERLQREKDAMQIKALTAQVESMALEIEKLRAQVEANGNGHI